MFWRKKVAPRPLGVPLDDILQILAPTTINASMDGSTLVAQHEHFTTLVDVVAPKQRQTPDAAIQAVVRIRTELPKAIQGIFRAPEMTADLNALSSLGSLCWDRGKVFVGARLTMYEGEEAWPTLQLPLLAFSVISGTDAILGGMRRQFSNEAPRNGASDWTEQDMQEVLDCLASHCVCTGGGLGVTAEFGLSGGNASAVRGDQGTALFQMMADQPHPEVGGGLFCLLQMPHRVTDERELRRLCLQMNALEMEAADLPPHFGAWCPGRLGNNLAYVAFYPNPLHEVHGFALNAAFWAIGRAMWADQELTRLGVKR